MEKKLHMKLKIWSFSILIMLINPLCMNAQADINEKMLKFSKCVEKRDTKEADKVLNSIKESDVATLSDSLKCFYHYYSAIIDIQKGNVADLQARAHHLELAKYYMERAPHMGIGFYDYPFIVQLLGDTYLYSLNDIDKAILAWEDGVVKCSTLLDSYDTFQNDCYKNIFSGLAEGYERKGNHVFASMFDFCEKRSVEQVEAEIDRLVCEAIDCTENKKYNEALNLLRRAENVLSKSAYSDQYNFIHLILTQRAYVYALNHNQELIEVLEKLYKLCYKKNLMKAFYSVLPNVCSRLVIAQDFDMLDYVLQLGNQAKKSEIKAEDKQYLNECRNNYKGYLLFKHNQDSVAHDYLTLEHTCPKWVISSLSLAKSYIISFNYDKSILIINEVLNLLKEIGKEHSVAYYEALVIITDAYFKKNDFISALPLIKELEILTKQYLGNKSLEYGQACNKYAQALININFQEAGPYLEIAREIFCKNFKEDDESMISLYNNEGRFYMLSSEFEMAKDRLTKAVELQKKYYGYSEIQTQRWLDEVVLTLNTTL